MEALIAGHAPVVSRSASSVAGTRTLGALFLSGSCATALLYLAIAYQVNPVRDFASGSRAFPAVRSDYRAEKIELLDEYLKVQPVEGLILGSSRSMLLNSERLRRSSGLNFFNFGLASAKGEDFLAALRWTRQRNHSLRLVIIGLDIESLRDAAASHDSIHPLRELATGSPSSFEYARTILPRVATLSYARDVAFSIYLSFRPRPSSVTFSPDGTLQYRLHDQQRRDGTFSLQNGIDVCMASARKKVEASETLSTTQVEYLRRTIEEATGSGARVEVWLTGPHPRTAAFMASGTNYADLRRHARELLRTLKSEAVQTFDFHDEQSYGGDPKGWYDCNHFDDTHAVRIERLLVGEQKR